MYNILNKLSMHCLRGDKVININKFDNLTVISSTARAGKNTLMKGIMLGYNPEDNFTVLTESAEFSSGFHDLSKTMMSAYGDVNLEKIVHEFEQTECNNLFVEQYISCGRNKNKQFKDLNYLREYSKTSGKAVYICVHLPRQSL